MEKFSFKDVLILFAGTIITIGIAWVLLTVTGFVPREIGKLFFEGAVVGQRNILNTLNIATPYILTSIATVVSFRVGMFNIGINGSMYIGGLYAAWAGYKFTSLGHIPHVSLCIAIAIITGSLWMLLPALLKVYAGVSEIISTIILNFVAVLFVSYMANGPFRADPIAPATPRILETAEFIWEFDDKDPKDPSTWYADARAEMQMKELAGTGMVEVYNNQHLWNNRQYQKVYDAFVDIWGTEKLWVTIDRANLNFPIRPGFEYKGFIHWDYDPDTKPQNVQGVLALSDQTDQNMGGFQCIPWLYKNYETWKLSQPEGRDKFKPDITGLEDKLVKVSLEAGDLLIFNSTQPHGIRPNNSKDKVRIAQYISMMPAQENDDAIVQWRVNSWKNRIAPEGYAFPGDPRNWEQKKYKTAELSSLGRKVLGLDKW